MRDEDFNLTVENAVKVERSVEMYQWKEIEHEEKDWRGKPWYRYTYEREWK